MTWILESSQLLLSVILVTSSSLVRRVLRDVIQLRALYPPTQERPRVNGLELGSFMPPFRWPVFESSEVVDSRELLGQPVLLLFVRPADALALRTDSFLTMIYAMWNKVDDILYLVCMGSEEECRSLEERFQLRQKTRNRIKLLVDARDELRRLFAITSWPSAVMYDREGRLRKVGQTQADGATAIPELAQAER